MPFPLPKIWVDSNWLEIGIYSLLISYFHAIRSHVALKGLETVLREHSSGANITIETLLNSFKLVIKDSKVIYSLLHQFI